MKKNQNNETPEHDYSRKPKHIGQLVRQLAAESGYDKKYMGAKLNLHFRYIYRFYESDITDINRLIELSDIFNRNLLLEYHPNVKPLPNPLQQELDDAKEKLSEMDVLERKNELLKKENLELKAQNDAYRDMLEKFAGRRG